MIVPVGTALNSRLVVDRHEHKKVLICMIRWYVIYRNEINGISSQEDHHLT